MYVKVKILHNVTIVFMPTDSKNHVARYRSFLDTLQCYFESNWIRTNVLCCLTIGSPVSSAMAAAQYTLTIKTLQAMLKNENIMYVVTCIEKLQLRLVEKIIVWEHLKTVSRSNQSKYRDKPRLESPFMKSVQSVIKRICVRRSSWRITSYCTITLQC